MKIFFMSCFIFMSCNSVNYYPADQVKIKQVQKTDTGILIIYSVLPETMYYSSGANVTYSKDSSLAKVNFVRQRIETHDHLDIESHLIRQADSSEYKNYQLGDVFIILPKKVQRIQLGNSEKIIGVN